jgi:molybdenum-dependent DNA-binding transcriptional regulator ModE
MKSAIVMAAILAMSIATVAGPAFADHPDSDTTEFATNIEFIRGHLEKVVENKKAGDNGLALAHAGHPIGEVYSLIKADVEEHDPALSTKLESSLTSIFEQIGSMSVAQLEAKVAEINARLDEAVEAVVSESEREDPAFWAVVITKLLETAEHEYEEGVQDGEVAEMVEYQDASAFIHRAKVVFESIEAETPEHEAEEVNEFFEQLDALVARPASAGEVETVINGINHELEEAFELEAEEEELGGWEYIDRIEELLDEAVVEYEEGNYDTARALAVEAYLDNYEFIESDIAEDNEELMEQIEVDMRVELVRMMDERRPVGEVSAHVDQIKSDLATAKAIVTPEFPVAIALVAAVMGAAVVAGRFRGAIFRSP